MNSTLQRRSIWIAVLTMVVLLLLRNILGEIQQYGDKSYYVLWEHGWPIVVHTRFNDGARKVYDYTVIDALPIAGHSEFPRLSWLYKEALIIGNSVISLGIISLAAIAATVRPTPIWQFSLRTLLLGPPWYLCYKFLCGQFYYGEAVAFLSGCIYTAIVFSCWEIWRQRKRLFAVGSVTG